MKVKIISSFLLVLSVAILLSGCGKKGGPFFPEDQEKVYPRQYPKE